MAHEINRRLGRDGSMAVAAALLLLSACTADPTPQPSATDDVVFSIDVVDDDWQGTSDWQTETFSVTRAGETIDGLKSVADIEHPAAGEGFGIYGWELLGGSQRQVTWHSDKGQWNMGELIYWKNASDASNTFNVYAYAPHKSGAGEYTFTEETSTYTFTRTWPTEAAQPSVTQTDGTDDATPTGKLTFEADAADGLNTDLLYAHANVKRSDGVARLTFRHALAQLSFGTIQNSTGEDITLSKVTISGKFITEGQLNMTDGTWSGTPSETTIEYTRSDFDPETPGDQSLSLTQEPLPMNIQPVRLIPGPEATITLTFDKGKFSFTTTLEKGKDKKYNINVRKNFEVEIED